MSVTASVTISTIQATATILASLTVGGADNMAIITATLPASGSTITDVDGATVGTYTDASEIEIGDLDGVDLKNVYIHVNGTLLRYANSTDNNNDIDDALSVGGTIKLIAGRDRFVRGRELRILYLTS